MAGKGGTTGTWSIEKPVKLTDEDIDEELMYNVMKKFILTEEQLVENCFPRPDPEVLFLNLTFEKIRTKVVNKNVSQNLFTKLKEVSFNNL